VKAVINADDVRERMIWSVAEEREAAGKAAAPGGKKVDDIDDVQQLLPEVRAEGQKRWDALSPDEQKKEIADQQEMMDAMLGQAVGAIRQEGFLKSFGMFDFLWIFLAVGTAFKIGSGSNSD
jgi:hypothetical protein